MLIAQHHCLLFVFRKFPSTLVLIISLQTALKLIKPLQIHFPLSLTQSKMLFSKVIIAMAGFLFGVSTAVIGLVSPDDYITAAAQQSNSRPDDIRNRLINNGAKPKIDAALQEAQDKSNAHDGIACDAITCQACVDCQIARVDVSIDIATTWGVCAITCLIIEACPGAIAAASVVTADICAKFCNDQHQPFGCNMDCHWATC